MSLAKRKCRQYSQEYLALGFITSPENDYLPLCLICEKIFNNDYMKPSKMRDHMERIHPAKKDRCLEYFKNLKEKFANRSKTGLKSFLKPSISANYAGGLEASYNISLLIAKAGYPHTIGEKIILPAIQDVIKTVMKMDPEPVLKSIPLSNNSVQRRIDDMSEHNIKSLISELQTSKFSVQLDESTFGRNSILMIYVRYYSPRIEEMTEEFLTAEQLQTYATGEHIFNCFQNFLQQNEIPITNITAASCDGAPAMVGKYRGFLAFLKKKVPDILTVHCVLHRQHLIAKKLQENLHSVLQLCIKAINTIKANSLNDRLFAQLCENNDEIYNNLLLHTEVRWLSKGNCLQRFIEIFNSVIEFLLEIDKPMATKLIESKKHIFYLADIFSLFNNIQNKIQGKNVNLVQVRSVIFGFRTKIDLFISTLNRNDFRYFENIMQLSLVEKDNINADDIQLYTDHLKQLKEDINVRYKDLENLDVPLWIINPFESDTANVDFSLQEELIELKENLESKINFQISGFAKFWNCKDIREKYVTLTNITESFFLAFPSSYLVEAGFSHVNNLLRKSRNRLNITERGDLRLLLTNFTPDIKRIIKKHQPQPSH